MPQTLMATLAMMLLITFSTSQLRESVETQREVISDELEVMAHAVASKKLQYVLSKGFDQKLGNQSLRGTTTSLQNMLTDPSNFGTTLSCWQADDPCDYLEQFDGATTTATFATRSDTSDTTGIEFDVEVAVDYMAETNASGDRDAGGTVSSTPTAVKRVQVKVSHAFLRDSVIKQRYRSPR